MEMPQIEGNGGWGPPDPPSVNDVAKMAILIFLIKHSF